MLRTDNSYGTLVNWLRFRLNKPTVNVTLPDEPLAVVTVTLWSAAVAPEEIVNVAISDVPLINVAVPLVTPDPSIAIVLPPGAKFVPVRVTVTTWPGVPLEGDTEVNVGATVGLTVSVTGMTTAEFDACADVSRICPE